MGDRIGCDVDGVLADFTAGFRRALVEVSGRELVPPGYQPTVWDWPRAVGYSAEEEAAAWSWIARSPTFWCDLPALPGAWQLLRSLSRLDPASEVYFVTNRPGSPTAKRQTERWLVAHGYEGHPTVLVVRGSKGAVAGALDLTVVIDDRPENCRDVLAAVPDAQVILPVRAWNRRHGVSGLLEVRDLRAIVAILGAGAAGAAPRHTTEEALGGARAGRAPRYGGTDP